LENLPPRVHFEGLSKHYPGVQALDRVNFSIHPGCVHALVGENGAGKSTLMKILAGAARADSGTISMDGRRVQIDNVRQAQAFGIATVYQELNLAEQLTVSENVFLGHWPRGRCGLISFRELHARAEGVFRSLGLELPVRQKVGGMSLAQQQMVEIARGFASQARLLLLDEPSAVLTPRELSVMFDLVRNLAQRGCSILYVSHRLDEVFSLADHVTVLRDGKHISTRPIGIVNRDLLIRELVGRAIEAEFPRRTISPGGIVLQVGGLSVPRRVDNVSFDVRAGEVFALTGLVGSGRSSLGKALFGCLPNVTGQVLVDSTRGPFRSPRAAKGAGVAFLPEDRKGEGLLLDRSLQENTALAHLRDVSRYGFLLPGAERRLAQKAMSEYGIVAGHPGMAVATLSGGNQQKVMIARWLQRHYHVIILDEPTRGVDVGAKVELYGLINRMAGAGAAVILITSELPEAIGMADRIGVMAKGRLVDILDNRAGQVSQEQIMGLAVT
jgi:ribose transport system ATP-binding protein